jgi:hypothetical protein
LVLQAAHGRSGSIIESMVIDMDEAQVRTLEQVRQVLAGTQVMEFQAAAGDQGRYAWIESVLRRFEYRRLPRAHRAPVLAYLQRLSGYSRSQVTRLVSRWDAVKPLVIGIAQGRLRWDLPIEAVDRDRLDALYRLPPPAGVGRAPDGPAWCSAAARA